MTKRSTDWHIAGWKAFVLAPFVIPIILILKFFGIGQTRDRTSAEVAGYIRDFIDGTGGEWDWDDFTSVPIATLELETIRAQAAMIQLPVDSAGIVKLKYLLAKAEALQGSSVGIPTV